MTTWHGGKGSEQRKTNRQRFSENYDKIFKKEKQLDERLQPREESDRSGHSESRGDNVNQSVSEQEGV